MPELIEPCTIRVKNYKTGKKKTWTKPVPLQVVVQIHKVVAAHAVIGIQEYEISARSVLCAEIASHAPLLVGFEEIFYAAIAHGFHSLSGAIVAPIVHNDYLVISECLVKYRTQRALNNPGAVVGRYDYGKCYPHNVLLMLSRGRSKVTLLI